MAPSASTTTSASVATATATLLAVLRGASAATGGLRGLGASATTWEGRGLCGLATDMLDTNDHSMRTYCNMHLGFWWNWDHKPKIAYSSPCSTETFTPMIWGLSAGHQNQAFASSVPQTRLMGYNEPDLWGPPAIPGGNYLSSGTFAPTFQCGNDELAKDWQALVLAFKAKSPDGLVVSPAMADADPAGTASAGDYSQCNISPQTNENHLPYCGGWLKCFKESVSRFQCGENTNCWEVIDVLQFHAYEYTSENLIKKVKTWETTWAEDLSGANGAKPKSLWLTEFARAGATDSSDPDGKTAAFMDQSIAYMKASSVVSGWSWFSQDTTTFASFTIGDLPPASPFWASDLINANGDATVIGEHYASLCKGL
mmetsp:Transcript_37986/g.121076  ORF Transcript_37986/g.121076 Transcript_37986/m.121076 type:complete len:370 (+) Transcript_37986:57-1166(+)